MQICSEHLSESLLEPEENNFLEFLANPWFDEEMFKIDCVDMTMSKDTCQKSKYETCFCYPLDCMNLDQKLLEIDMCSIHLEQAVLTIRAEKEMAGPQSGGCM